ncbi:MAG: hypothetical protein LBG24_07655 [Treponema sp.]|nr:hypothetical protein [Treponema sp.]
MKTFVRFFTFTVALMGLVFTTCKLDSNEPDPVITYRAVADGSSEAASTAITFTFATALTGLEAGDITLSNGTGQLTKGALTQDGDGRVWKLGITVHKTGTVKVAIGKAGIAEGETELTVYKEPDITYTATANGSDNTETSTTIAFTFNKAVEGLSAENITLSNDTGAATKGALSGSGTNWSLGITVQTAGPVKVRITRDGIEGTEKPVRVFKAGEEAGDIAYTVAADGSATAASTQITFAFDAAVTGLSTEDITLSNDTGAATKGALSGSGTSWSLGIAVQTAGAVKVTITRDGIEAGEKPVKVYAAPAPSGPALTKPIDLYLSEGLTREEWTGQGTATEGWVLSVEEQATVYVAAYKEAAQAITVSGQDQALVGTAGAVDNINAGEDFAVFTVKTGDLVFDGGTRTFTLNVEEEGGALPRSVTVTLKVNTNPTGAAVFKLADRDGEGVEYLERIGGDFDGFLAAFEWVETNAQADTEYTIRVEKDERDVPHLVVGLNNAENATLRLKGTQDGIKTLYPVDLVAVQGQEIPVVDASRLGYGTTFSFIQVGGGNALPTVTFILGSNIAIQSGRVIGGGRMYTYILNVLYNATIVLESGSVIRDHDNTLNSNRLIFMQVKSLGGGDKVGGNGKLLIKGGAIINCKIVDNKPLIDMSLNETWWEDGSFYLAPGNVFTLSDNSSNLIGTTTETYQEVFIDLTEYLASGLKLPRVPRP